MGLCTAAVRLHPRFGEAEANRAASTAAIDAAAAAGARLVVLPELCSSGYCIATEAEADSACEPLDGPTVAAWTAAARRHDLVIVGGLAERDDAGQRRNSAVVVDAAGLQATYRKVHLWGIEKRWFVAGDELPPVVSTSVGRLGIGICYDLWFPELCRSLADRGAELLVFPSNLTDDPPITVRDHVYTAVARAEAHRNRTAIVVADRCGTERGATWTGAAIIIDATGALIGAPLHDDDRPELVIADLPTPGQRETAWGDANDVVGDRRPDLFSG